MIAAIDPPKPKADRRRLKPGISHDMEELKKHKKLSPEELGELARQLAETPDHAEAERLADEIMKGFYGTK